MKGRLHIFALGCMLLANAWMLSLDALACTTAIISAEAAGGRPLLWKQRDTSDPYNVLEHRKGERYSYTALFGSSDKARTSAYLGANDQGFAIVNNLSYNLRPDSLAGRKTIAGRIIAEALGTCRTVEDFERLLREKPQPNGLETNFAVIDAEGGAAYFEVWDYGITRFDVEKGGYLFRTNFSFSGKANSGKGYARYETVADRMGKRSSKGFTPQWLLSDLGRSFNNTRLHKPLLDLPYFGKGLSPDIDYVPRFTTTASVVIEGVAKGGNPSSSILWTAIGYTPCCYAVPVWVAAGDAIPSCVAASAGGKAPANVLAEELKLKLHPITYDGGAQYIDMGLLKKSVAGPVRKAEKESFNLGRDADAAMRRDGFSLEAVRRLNAEIDSRFSVFETQMRKLL